LRYANPTDSKKTPRAPTISEQGVIDVFACADAAKIQKGISINGARDTITLDPSVVSAEPHYRLSEAGAPNVFTFTPERAAWAGLKVPQNPQYDPTSVSKVNAMVADIADPKNKSELAPRIAIKMRAEAQAALAESKKKDDVQLRGVIAKALIARALDDLKQQAKAQGVDVVNTRFVVATGKGRAPQSMGKEFAAGVPKDLIPADYPIGVNLDKAVFKKAATGVGNG
jgi:hypothetical protein